MVVFESFFISSSFGGQISKNVFERGRNIMCEGTFPNFRFFLKSSEFYEIDFSDAIITNFFDKIWCILTFLVEKLVK